MVKLEMGVQARGEKLDIFKESFLMFHFLIFHHREFPELGVADSLYIPELVLNSPFSTSAAQMLG